MEYLTKGKRSLIYIDFIKGKKVIIKKESRNLNRINLEVQWLKKLNKYNLGPKLIDCGNDYLIIEFIKGKRFLEWLNESRKQKRILKEILGQCRLLDKLKTNKYELTNPYKHIIINKKPVMIDFERCKFALKPKNVTQFCQFLMSAKVYPCLEFKFDKKEVKKLLIEYKLNQTEKDYQKLLEKVLSKS